MSFFANLNIAINNPQLKLVKQKEMFTTKKVHIHINKMNEFKIPRLKLGITFKVSNSENSFLLLILVYSSIQEFQSFILIVTATACSGNI